MHVFPKNSAVFSMTSFFHFKCQNCMCLSAPKLFIRLKCSYLRSSTLPNVLHLYWARYFTSSQSYALGIRQSTQIYQLKGKAFSMTFVNSIPSKPMHIHSQNHNLTNHLHQQDGQFPSQVKFWAERFHLALGPTRRVLSAHNQSDRPKQSPQGWTQGAVKETQQPSISSGNGIIASAILKNFPHLPLKYQVKLNQKKHL